MLLWCLSFLMEYQALEAHIEGSSVLSSLTILQSHPVMSFWARKRQRAEADVSEPSIGLVKQSLCKAEEGWIKDDSRGHILIAVSRVGMTDWQGGSLSGARKGSQS